MSDTRTLPKPLSKSVLFMIIKAVGMSTNKFGFLLLYKKRELKMKGRSYKKRELKEKRRSYKKRELKMKLNAKGTPDNNMQGTENETHKLLKQRTQNIT